MRNPEVGHSATDAKKAISSAAESSRESAQILTMLDISGYSEPVQAQLRALISDLEDGMSSGDGSALTQEEQQYIAYFLRQECEYIDLVGEDMYLREPTDTDDEVPFSFRDEPQESERNFEDGM